MDSEGMTCRLRRVIRPTEIGCYTAALNETLRRLGTLENLPPGTLRVIGGLLPETAEAVESVIQQLQAAGEHLTVGRVMAEIDRSIDY